MNSSARISEAPRSQRPASRPTRLRTKIRPPSRPGADRGQQQARDVSPSAASGGVWFDFERSSASPPVDPEPIAIYGRWYNKRIRVRCTRSRAEIHARVHRRPQQRRAHRASRARPTRRRATVRAEADGDASAPHGTGETWTNAKGVNIGASANVACRGRPIARRNQRALPGDTVGQHGDTAIGPGEHERDDGAGATGDCGGAR